MWLELITYSVGLLLYFITASSEQFKKRFVIKYFKIPCFFVIKLCGLLLRYRWLQYLYSRLSREFSYKELRANYYIFKRFKYAALSLLRIHFTKNDVDI